MSNIEFPARTAGDVILPGGETVWVCTLNTLHRDQADAKARRYAQNECRGLLKGGSDYPAVLAEVKSMSVESQAAYLAQQEFFSIRQEAGGKYPDPQEPEQGGDAPDVYAKAVAEWEAACKKQAEKRARHEETRYKAEIKRATDLSVPVRIERCCTAYFARQFTEAFIARMTVETLYRAVRQADDHTQRYFSCVEAVEDCDDGTLKALTDFYYRDIDTVKSDDIPTSPAAS